LGEVRDGVWGMVVWGEVYTIREPKEKYSSSKTK